MFTTDVANFLRMFFGKVYDLFGITWPGTNLSILGIFLGVMGTYFTISLVQQFTGFGISVASSQKGGNNKNIKISKDRKGDEK